MLCVVSVCLVSFHNLSGSGVVCGWCFSRVFSQFVYFRCCLWLVFLLCLFTICLDIVCGWCRSRG